MADHLPPTAAVPDTGTAAGGAAAQSAAGTAGAAGAPGQERGRRSREEILDAVVASLLEDGYAATTTMKVQERAGVSRGKLLHHFPSKRHLITDAVRRLAEQRLDETTLRSREGVPAPSDVPARLAWALEVLWESFFHPNFWAAMETWIAARTDPALADELVAHEKQVLRRVRENIRGLFGEEIAAHPQYRAMVDVVFTSMRGMAITYMFSRRDPRTEPMRSTWLTSARALLELE